MRLIDPDKLANFIRAVDGSNKLGAGALAEKICELLEGVVGQQQPRDDGAGVDRRHVGLHTALMNARDAYLQSAADYSSAKDRATIKNQCALIGEHMSELRNALPSTSENTAASTPDAQVTPSPFLSLSNLPPSEMRAIALDARYSDEYVGNLFRSSLAGGQADALADVGADEALIAALVRMNNRLESRGDFIASDAVKQTINVVRSGRAASSAAAPELNAAAVESLADEIVGNDEGAEGWVFGTADLMRFARECVAYHAALRALSAPPWPALHRRGD